MAESLVISGSTKEERYASLLPQMRALVEGEPDFVANLSNIVAALRQSMQFFWIGVYIVKGDELVLGPFQGPVACTRIRRGKGVCGTAWDRGETILVPDVDLFPGHIACSSASRSEIVVPVKDASGNVLLVIDADSDKPDDFDAIDQHWLEETAKLIAGLCIPEKK